MAAAPDLQAERLGAARPPDQEQELGLEHGQDLQHGREQEPGLELELDLESEQEARAALVDRRAVAGPQPATCRASSACPRWEALLAALRRARASAHQAWESGPALARALPASGRGQAPTS